MKRRWVVVVLLGVLAATGLAARWWLAPLLAFLGAQKDLMQMLSAVATILGTLAAAGALWAFLRRPRPRDQARIDQLRDRIRQLNAARGAMDEATIEELIAECRAELRRLTGSDLAAAQAEAGGLGPPRGATARGVAIRGDANVVMITGDGHRILASKADPELLFNAYLASLAGDCSQLPLTVIDTEFVRGGAPAVRLPEVYVELDVGAHRRPREEEEREWAWRLVRGEAAGRRPALEALAEPGATRHVLLGDPGSGKTTFANYLCHLLADREASVPEELEGLVPVRFVLRDVAARHIPPDAPAGTAGMLWNALRDNLASYVGEEAADGLFQLVRTRLLECGGFIVLDGLDEVPESHRRRQVLLAAVASFAAALAGSRLRMLITARPYAYADPRWHLTDFAILALAPFSEEQVRAFIDRWYSRAARRIFAWSEGIAAARGRQLQAAVEAHPYLGDLASRPLLLTLMATLHSSWGQLPEDRADLYEETVTLLLSRWQRAREVRDASGKPVREEGISQVLAVEESRLRQALEALAFAVHERQGGEPKRGSEPADIRESDLLVAFKPLLGTLKADDLWHYLRDRAGLLISRRGEGYAFPHRSFQEFLAACHLSRLPDPSERLREKAFADPVWWREVVLLGIGRSKRAGLGAAVAIVAALQPADPAPPDDIGDDPWRVAVICGQALLDIRLGEAAAGHPRYRVLLERARLWLVELIEKGRLTLRERLEAGDVLGHLGDPRRGVGILSDVTAEGGELPDVTWVEIPAGTFTMGSAEGELATFDEEHPVHEVLLDRYWISRYPITNSQFRPFCDGDGYQNREYWTDAGWAWLEAAEPDLSAYSEEIRDQTAKWLARRPKGDRRQPFFWEDPKLSIPSRPVVGVTWYEAVAYCRWLGARLRSLRDLSLCGVDLEQGLPSVVSLPSEARWEKAARGTGSFRWPWGDEFGEDACNCSETGLEQTSPVGIFPQTTSPYGVFDLSGNVWEWTSTIWSRSDVTKPEHKYPYTSDDGREEMEGIALRILRGGSWRNDRRSARCAARGRNIPEFFGDDVGFRVALRFVTGDVHRITTSE